MLTAKVLMLICLSLPPRNQCAYCLEACRKYVLVFKFQHARMQHTLIHTQEHKRENRDYEKEM